MADYTPVKGFWQANASESAPSMATLSSQGYPTNGDPRKGTPATIPGAAWYYWVDQAIRAVIAASGKTSANPPSPTELRDALQSLGWLNEKSVKASMLDLDNIADSSLSATSTRPVQNKVVKSALDWKLSTSGGTMTGGITLNSSVAKILKADKNGSLVLSGGNVDSSGGAGSAILWLGGGDDSSAFNSPGEFSLQASKGTYGQPGFSSYDLNGKPDGSLTWGGKPVLCGESGGFPVGFLALYAGSNVPNGWFRCDGSTIADMATNYPKLYAVLGTNVLPNYSGRVPLGASSAINTAVEAGLPNIEGTMYPVAVGFVGDAANQTSFSASGAFFNDGGNAPVDAYATGQFFLHYIKIGIDASRSNTIYSKSTTVQPPAVKVAVLIRHD